MSESPKSPKTSRKRTLDEWARICTCVARIAKQVGAAFAALAQILKEIQTLRPTAEGAA